MYFCMLHWPWSCMKHKSERNNNYETKIVHTNVIMFLLYIIDEDMSVETVQHALLLWR